MHSQNTIESFIELLRDKTVTTKNPLNIFLNEYSNGNFKSNRTVQVPAGTQFTVNFIEEKKGYYIPAYDFFSTGIFLDGKVDGMTVTERIVYMRQGLTEAMFREDFLIT